MGREIKRVPTPFNWPLEKVWGGYVRPEHLRLADCGACGGRGYSPEALRLHDRWYGYVPFAPAETGSAPFTAETPEVRAFAERNVKSSPSYYGHGEAAIIDEARRLCGHWNASWSHHLAQEDVDALVEGGRLHDLTHTWAKGEGWKPKDPMPAVTAAEVNRWSLVGFGHDSINAHMVIAAACRRQGISELCPECRGDGGVELWPGQRAEADAWEPTEPPTGEGWQLWETVSEGSPITPAFATAAELVDHLVNVGDAWGQKRGTTWNREAAERIVKDEWAPSLMVDSADIHTPEGN